MRVLKYAMGQDAKIRIPDRARPLHFGFQGDMLVMWAAVPEYCGDKLTQVFEVFPTGVDVPEDSIHLASAVHASGMLVFHCFEVH